MLGLREGPRRDQIFVDWEYKEKSTKEKTENELAERLENNQNRIKSWKLREEFEEYAISNMTI